MNNIKLTLEELIASSVKYNREYRRLGRNDHCKCGSGKKYKHCCKLEYDAINHNLSDELFNNRINNFNDASYYVEVHGISRYPLVYGFKK